jgi:hypothetical protein
MRFCGCWRNGRRMRLSKKALETTKCNQQIVIPSEARNLLFAVVGRTADSSHALGAPCLRAARNDKTYV